MLCSALDTVFLLHYYFNFFRCNTILILIVSFCFISYSAFHAVFELWSQFMPEVQSSSWRFCSMALSSLIVLCLVIFHKLISILSGWNIFPAHTCILQLIFFFVCFLQHCPFNPKYTFHAMYFLFSQNTANSLWFNKKGYFSSKPQNYLYIYIKC